jgi:hypothetical protein
MGGAPNAIHPDAGILALYAAGRLGDAEMARLEKHIGGCPVCLAALDQVPEDPLVRLLRGGGNQVDVGSGSVGGEGSAGSDQALFFDAAENPSASPGDHDATESFIQNQDGAGGPWANGPPDNVRYSIRPCSAAEEWDLSTSPRTSGRGGPSS